MKIHFYIPLLLISFAAGCWKEGVIEEDKFVRVYADLLVAGDTISVDRAKKEVFLKYRITESDYQNTVEHYNSNPEEWESFFNKVIAHIEAERKKSVSSQP